MHGALIICQDAESKRLIKANLHRDASVFLADDVPTARQFAERKLHLLFIDVTLVAEPFAEAFQAIIADFRRSGTPLQVVALSPKDRVRRAVEAVRHGADEYLTYPIDDAEVDLVLENLRNHLVKQSELEYLRGQFWKSDWLAVVRTSSPVMKDVFEKIRSVAPTIATVLLLGETGTGKGLMARLIHRHSQRRENPFVEVHCGAIPDTLIESELFGHERGAFTGADRRRIGKFEMARNGTIFLDEIGTITSAAQIKLLQVLQDGTFNRVGGAEQLHTDARIIAATNADLEQMANTGAFRRDLFFRLNVFPIALPTLAQRLEDLPDLAGLFLDRLNKKYGKHIHGLKSGLAKMLQTYSWPGNLRELENVMERAYILETGDVLSPESFPEMMIIGSRIAQAVADDATLPQAVARQIAVDEFERTYLSRLLDKHRGKIGLSAREANITSRQLSRLVAKHGLDKKKSQS